MASPVQRGACRPRDVAAHAWVIVQEAAGSFFRNSDLRQASSLAFYATLALIPALLLLTFLMGLAIGSSQAAMHETAEFTRRAIPTFGEVVLEEVRSLTSHPRTAGTLNLLALTWSLTPLVSSLRECIGGMFRVRTTRTLLAAKIMDLAMGMVFVCGLAVVAGAGVLMQSLARLSRTLPHGFRLPPGLGLPLGLALPLVLTALLAWGVYFAFTSGVSKRHLLAGALAATLLWFLLRPAFTLFLTWDQGYGFAFGSFKSIFIVVIWIYYSMAVLLFGAEVAAALHRGEALMIRRLMEGRRGLPVLGRDRRILEAPADWVFFREGDAGGPMFFVLEGAVSIRKGGQELAVVRPHSFFGEMTFLLGQPRSATAVALEPCRCVAVRGENFDDLMAECPDLVREMLVEMAARLRATSAAETEERRVEVGPEG